METKEELIKEIILNKTKHMEKYLWIWMFKECVDLVELKKASKIAEEKYNETHNEHRSVWFDEICKGSITVDEQGTVKLTIPASKIIKKQFEYEFNLSDMDDQILARITRASWNEALTE